MKAEKQRARQEVRTLQSLYTIQRIILFQQEEQRQRENVRLMAEATVRLQQEVSHCRSRLHTVQAIDT